MSLILKLNLVKYRLVSFRILEHHVPGCKLWVENAQTPRITTRVSTLETSSIDDAIPPAENWEQEHMPWKKWDTQTKSPCEHFRHLLNLDY